MGRKSKLTPEQWADIEVKLLGGQSRTSIGKEYGISEATIRARFAGPVDQVQAVAAKIVDARQSLQALPPLAQISANSLAQKLIAISQNLAGAAEAGSATAYRLNSLANSEVAKVDDATPMDSIENLRNVGVLTKLANDSASIALNLLAANKERVQKMQDAEEPPPETPIRPQVTRDEWLKLHGHA